SSQPLPPVLFTIPHFPSSPRYPIQPQHLSAPPSNTVIPLPANHLQGAAVAANPLLVANPGGGWAAGGGGSGGGAGGAAGDGLGTNQGTGMAGVGSPVEGYRKLHVWRLEEYDWVLYLDVDVLITRNLDHLFPSNADNGSSTFSSNSSNSGGGGSSSSSSSSSGMSNKGAGRVEPSGSPSPDTTSPHRQPCPEPLAAAPDVYEADRFNAGVLLVRPSLSVFRQIVRRAKVVAAAVAARAGAMPNDQHWSLGMVGHRVFRQIVRRAKVVAAAVAARAGAMPNDQHGSLGMAGHRVFRQIVRRAKVVAAAVAARAGAMPNDQLSMMLFYHCYHTHPSCSSPCSHFPSFWPMSPPTTHAPPPHTPPCRPMSFLPLPAPPAASSPPSQDFLNSVFRHWFKSHPSCRLPFTSNAILHFPLPWYQPPSFPRPPCSLSPPPAAPSPHQQDFLNSVFRHLYKSHPSCRLPFTTNAILHFPLPWYQHPSWLHHLTHPLSPLPPLPHLLPPLPPCSLFPCSPCPPCPPAPPALFPLFHSPPLLPIIRIF
ncbi:unnamed protein product, partial [Closterium sp. Naga37s-1]